MNLYKETTLKLGNIRPKQKDVRAFWEFDELTKDRVATYKDSNGVVQPAIRVGCGCTANVVVQDDGIQALYNDRGNAKGVVTKNITVYYKTGDLPIRIKNDSGIETFNSELDKTVLFFEVLVK